VAGGADRPESLPERPSCPITSDAGIVQIRRRRRSRSYCRTRRRECFHGAARSAQMVCKRGAVYALGPRRCDHARSDPLNEAARLTADPARHGLEHGSTVLISPVRYVHDRRHHRRAGAWSHVNRCRPPIGLRPATLRMLPSGCCPQDAALRMLRASLKPVDDGHRATRLDLTQPPRRKRRRGRRGARGPAPR